MTPIGSGERAERQQSLLFAAALPNSLKSAEPNSSATEIDIKIPKAILKASFWPMGIGGGGSDHLLEIWFKSNPP
jgi:hypothetical protein